MLLRVVRSVNVQNRGYLLSNEELDEILGPIGAGTVILLEGLPGTGKTTFALVTAYRNAVENNSKALYLTFGETPEKLIQKALLLGLERIHDVVTQNQLKIIHVPMAKDESLVEFVSSTIFSEGTAQGYEIIVIDSVTPILELLKSYDLQRAWLQTTMYYFVSKAKVLLILIADMMSIDDPVLKLLEYVSDIVLEFSYSLGPLGTYERRLSIKKHRFKATKMGSYPFEIGKYGIRILNYVSRRKRGKLLARRKPIPIRCTPVRLAVGESIELGSQVFVMNKGYKKLSIPKLNAWKWMVDELLVELPAQGYRIGIVSFSINHAEKIRSKLSLLDANAAQNIVLSYLDPSMLAPHMILARGLEVIEEKELDIVVVLDEERLMETLGYEILKPYLVYALSVAKALGITVIRHVNLVPGLDPWLNLVWSDIVAELDIEESTNRPFIDIRVSGLAPRRIYDDDFAICVNA